MIFCIKNTNFCTLLNCMIQGEQSSETRLIKLRWWWCSIDSYEMFFKGTRSSVDSTIVLTKLYKTTGQCESISSICMYGLLLQLTKF